MVGRLENKIALVTGASSGLGKVTALAFARAGATVVAAARRKAELDTTVQTIRDLGGEAIAVRTDVSQPDQVEAMVDTAVATYGRLDVAFNNAGVFPAEGLVHEAPEDRWNTLMDTNLKGTWLCMKSELHYMLEQGSGSIVNMASSAGLVGWSDNPIYAASKYGVVGLSKSAALQYAPAGIRINVVCPAFTRIESMQAALKDNPQAEAAMRSTIPLGRIGRAEETAEAVLWLASDASSFCVGHALALDGGQTIGLWREDA
jgi:NAD(P)-dependent dehydrogenase (short-subunit alcohol dehydrogenase family)|tara:strand:+ start:570 stop:1349 length:780 start_codon:yes stop_codon:yes gene_type:complete